jgi:hypothetical protein
MLQQAVITGFILFFALCFLIVTLIATTATENESTVSVRVAETEIMSAVYSAMFIPHIEEHGSVASCGTIRARLGNLYPLLAQGMCKYTEEVPLAQQASLGRCLCGPFVQPTRAQELAVFDHTVRPILFPFGVWDCSATIRLLSDVTAVTYAQGLLCSHANLHLEDSCLCRHSSASSTYDGIEAICTWWTSKAIRSEEYGPVYAIYAQRLNESLDIRTAPEGLLDVHQLYVSPISLLPCSDEAAFNQNATLAPAFPISFEGNLVEDSVLCLWATVLFPGESEQTQWIELEIPCVPLLP